MTIKPNPQIYKDLDRWASDRLHTWFEDTCERFNQAGFKERDAFTASASTLLIMAADIMAFAEIPPNEAGQMFVHLINIAQRKQAANRKARQDATAAE